MRWHIRILAALNIAAGVAIAFVATVQLFQSFDSFLEPFLGGLFVGLGLFWTAIALPFALIILAIPTSMVVGGFGLLRMRRWASKLLVALSLLALPVIPISVVVGSYSSGRWLLPIGATTGALALYGLWVLLNRETQRLFTDPATST